jgi:glycine cleavage system aminomethyltransferase T
LGNNKRVEVFSFVGRALSRHKGDFRGKQPLFELEGKEKVKLFGIVAEHDNTVDQGARLSIEGEIAGHATSSTYSRPLGQSLALGLFIPALTDVDFLVMDFISAPIRRLCLQLEIEMFETGPVPESAAC